MIGVAGNNEDRVTSALRAVIRPLADLMIRSGITLSNATELLKQVLFDAAQKHGGGAVSDSQISLLTGLHRKDVRRFREAAAAGEGIARPAFATASARLLAHWHSAPGYVDADNAPCALPRSSATGPSFDGLVQELRFDLPSGTILQHLIEMGLVAQSDDGLLTPTSPDYVPLPGSDEMLVALEKNITSHLQAAVENLTQPAQPHFERASHFNKLSAASAEALEALARQLAQEHLATFNAEAQRLQQQDMTIASSTHRVSFGAYVVARDQRPKDPKDQDQDRDRDDT